MKISELGFVALFVVALAATMVLMGCKRAMCRLGVAPCAPLGLETRGEEPRGPEYGAAPWGDRGAEPHPDSDRLAR